MSIRSLLCLNPFRSGRCLSTLTLLSLFHMVCLNPFRSGRCLSTYKDVQETAKSVGSQSLSIRAMSFDFKFSRIEFVELSQSLSIRAMSFDVNRIEAKAKEI